jgi:hypothetical protein
VIRQQLDKPREFQAARFDRLDGHFWRYSHFGLWPARFAQDRCILAREPMPVDDGKMAGGLQGFAYSLRQSQSIGDSVEGIRQKNKVTRSWHKLGEVMRIPFYKVAIRYSAFSETMARHLQQIGGDVDRNAPSSRFEA